MIYYETVRGDTPRRIAFKYGVSLHSLMSTNQWMDEQTYLWPGQIVLVEKRAPQKYKVQPGDTLSIIAEAFGVSRLELLQANLHLLNKPCEAGVVIVIPPKSNDSRIVTLEGEYGYSNMMRHIERLTATYPFVTAEVIGRSVMGKPIPAIRIGCGPRQVHFNGAVHANEWITSPCLMQFIEDYACALYRGVCWQHYNVTDWYNHNTLWIVPMVNPDGVEIVQEGVHPLHPYYHQLLEWNNGRRQFRRWKANIRGVDLNDQFPAHWEEERERRGKCSPAPQDYSGPSPLSEPESVALAWLTDREKFDLALSLHTQGREIYWNYRSFEPSYAEYWALRLARAGGYRAVKLSGSDAGYKDWFIEKYGKPGFTVEAGTGINPLPLTDYEDIYAEVSLILAECLMLQ
ncbi:g-D-glutamyl-meso-diaminopimelate peptidase [Paenibacillus sediminis]|uniref:G-D-glutamyl-meso-diaminopimelate peptidase n=1 Tax=Paenibacillus sediminis TaxID=664909 RepID=A0ABS4H5W9_9BACL|nr:M14 family metallopeptidase [Paenibacillus sediminis]MBP1937782.1 g-D-glutamyl-meso-diaminopimelate peptidase [Paenibacillus sediminis]